ncbi:Biofilm associated protein A [Enterobacter cloacae]|uniref:Biofilm associated protein A n=1 Tax=Enterobacter cloacae TaxID=550 RepID=UPI0013D47DF5|nr:Biofilm associated protein A [Enterobacter cloacae]
MSKMIDDRSNNNADARTDEAINGQFPTLVEITPGDILIQGEENLFPDHSSKQLLIKGTPEEQFNLSDLLPADADPGEWMKARGSVTLDGVQYEVYHHPGTETELLVQTGVQVTQLA